MVFFSKRRHRNGYCQPCRLGSLVGSSLLNAFGVANSRLTAYCRITGSGQTVPGASRTKISTSATLQSLCFSSSRINDLMVLILFADPALRYINVVFSLCRGEGFQRYALLGTLCWCEVILQFYHCDTFVLAIESIVVQYMHWLPTLRLMVSFISVNGIQKFRYQKFSKRNIPTDGSIL